jgi:hypothetical protein
MSACARRWLRSACQESIRQTLRGYVLDELLARLIQNTGYRLLVDESQDVDELENRPNGLAIRGRGGRPQVTSSASLHGFPLSPFRFGSSSKQRPAMAKRDR